MFDGLLFLSSSVNILSIGFQLMSIHISVHIINQQPLGLLSGSTNLSPVKKYVSHHPMLFSSCHQISLVSLKMLHDVQKCENLGSFWLSAVKKTLFDDCNGQITLVALMLGH
jgi:hypothetical protein